MSHKMNIKKKAWIGLLTMVFSAGIFLLAGLDAKADIYGTSTLSPYYGKYVHSDNDLTLTLDSNGIHVSDGTDASYSNLYGKDEDENTYYLANFPIAIPDASDYNDATTKYQERNAQDEASYTVYVIYKNTKRIQRIKYIYDSEHWDINVQIMFVYSEPLSASSSDTSTATEQKENAASHSSHSHSYAWVTVKEPTEGEDGLEEYRCSCGKVEEQKWLSSGKVFVNRFYDAFTNAEPNSTIDLQSDYFVCFNQKMVDMIKEKNLNINLTYRFQGETYFVAIKAADDFETVQKDGYYGFAAIKAYYDKKA